MSQSLHCRPAILLGVEDKYVAWCVDRATFTLAMAINQDQDEAESRLPKNAKDAAHTRARQRVLDLYLGIDSAEQPGRFRSIG